jgi:MFS family permease
LPKACCRLARHACVVHLKGENVSNVASEAARAGQLRRTRQAALASFLGSMLEYYDFYIYASASALVFGEIIFTSTQSTVGLLASLASFGVAYAARPVGGIVLGHIGDRLGRKKVMVFTVVAMGSSTFLVGCLPDYRMLGLAAPALLMLLRLIQGFSAGGEQSGASAIILEHAPAGRRGYYTSWTMTGTTVGEVLASLAFVPVAAMPTRELLSWGWRVPFWFSALVVVIAYFVRRRLAEPTAAEQARVRHEVARLPLSDLLRTHPVAVIRVVACAMSASIGTIFAVFGLAYATETVGIGRETMLWVSIAANGVSALIMPFQAMLADRWGRKPVFLIGVIGCAACVPLYFAAIGTRNLPLIFVTAIALLAVFYGSVICVSTSFYSEMFATRVRFSGTAVGTQLGYLVAGFAPTIGYAIMGTGRNGWVPVAVMAAVICAIAAVSAGTSRETARLPIDALGSETYEPVQEFATKEEPAI